MDLTRTSRKATKISKKSGQKSEDGKGKKLKKRFSRNNLKKYCKNIFHFIFTTGGLSLLVVLYSFLGGLMFVEVEQANEIKKQKKLQERAADDRIGIVGKMGHRCLQIQLSTNESFWRNDIRGWIKELQKMTHNITSSKWDGTQPGEEIVPDWGLVNSVLFAVTIITTIGYGHIAPKTDLGMILCVAYAVFGVPILLLYLASIGSFMADVVRYTYHHLCCEMCWRDRCGKKKKSEILEEEEEDFSSRPSSEFASNRGGSSNIMEADSQRVVQGATNISQNNSYQLSQGRSSIQYGAQNKSHSNNVEDSQELTQNKQLVVAELNGPQTNLDTSVVHTLSTSNNNNADVNLIDASQNQNAAEGAESRQDARLHDDDAASTVLDMDQDHEDDDDLDHGLNLSFMDLRELDWKTMYRHKSVPVSMTVLIMISYLFIGALIFALWEEWSFVQALYFSFITLTTIGLGDLVPGLTGDNWFKQALCAIYVLLGMALIAMCMDLMMAKVKTRVVAFAQKVGIMEKEEEKQRRTDAEAVFAAIQT